MPITDTLKKHRPAIKRGAKCAYMVLLWALIVANAYVDQMLPTCIFAFLFALNILQDKIGDIATAIRTQRNFHIIGDANEINLRGSSLYADSVTVSDRVRKCAEVQ